MPKITQPMNCNHHPSKIWRPLLALVGLSRMFDMISHKIMLSICFSSDVVQVISLFLKNMTQLVVINGKGSAVLSVTYGVSQGGIRGHTLFTNMYGCLSR